MFSCAVRSMRIVDKEQNKENLKVGTTKKKQQPFVLYFFTGKTRIFWLMRDRMQQLLILFKLLKELFFVIRNRVAESSNGCWLRVYLGPPRILR
jgi:hypothetical protein